MKFDGFAKSPPPSLRGAKRRGNLSAIQGVMRLPRFARNDISAFFGLFTKPSSLSNEILCLSQELLFKQKTVDEPTLCVKEKKSTSSAIFVLQEKACYFLTS
jgi:hypothetical protein